jgi:3-oxoacyl-[acyl-carrier protein] reductase
MSKRVIVTGGSRGIGAEICRVLAPDSEVLVHYFASKGPAEEVATEVEKLGGRAYVAQADLTTPDGCRKLCDEAASVLGAVDVLVNNAGGLIQRHRVEELDWDVMVRTFSLNTFSTMMMTKLCIPLLRRGVSPVVVNITSVSMRYGAQSATTYGAANSAIDAFTRGAARELAPGIRVNAVAPGVIEVRGHEEVTTTAHLVSFRERTPLKKNGTPWHVASAVEFLVRNDFATGESVDVNGGIFMR